MRRRALLRLTVAGAALLGASGHTPYHQWTVYRQKHLFVLTCRALPGSFELGRRLADVLAEHLPASRARVSRAPSLHRIASLLSTKQMELALMPPADAKGLLEGEPPYDVFTKVALRSLLTAGEYTLVCRDDFRQQHAFLLIEALLLQRPADIAVSLPSGTAIGGVPLHPGAVAYRDGLELPQDAEQVQG